MAASSRTISPFNVVLESDETGAQRKSLIVANGDAEMWRRLCSFENPLPVLVVTVHPGGRTAPHVHLPKGALRGTRLSSRSARQPRTTWHAMVSPGAGGSGHRAASAGLSERTKVVPVRCPSGFVVPANKWRQGFQAEWQTTAEGQLNGIQRWSVRGAINAGLAVYTYLRALRSGEVKPPLAYDRCDLLSPGTATCE